jgi:phage internal scaffolding protein
MGFYKYDENGDRVIRKGKGKDCQAAIEAGEEVRVEQSHKEEVDINNIVRKHGADYIQKVAKLSEWRYDDVTGNDFQESMNALIKARDTFADVPSSIRKQFDNDPAKFLDFVQNPDNAAAMVEMGLAVKQEPEPPVEVAVVSAPETPPVESSNA